MPERLLIVLLLLPELLFAQPDPRAMVGEAWAAEQRGDYRRAVEFYRRAAEQGDPVAQYQLGLLYELGRGVAVDADEAEYWYGLATDQGFCPGEIPEPAEYAAP